MHEVTLQHLPWLEQNSVAVGFQTKHQQPSNITQVFHTLVPNQ
jgi:hypothetical protein